MGLHPIQQAILELAGKEDLAKLSLREIGRKVNAPSPQKVKFHLSQLEKKGLIRIDRMKGVIEKNLPGWASGLLRGIRARLYNIPIYGTASCGPEGIVAEQNLEGFLRVSNTLLGRRNPKRSFFAIHAEGNSMNRASIDGKSIDSGDYLVIDSEYGTPRNGDVVVAIIDDKAVVKKVVFDSPNEQILLISESTENYPPICIHEDDKFLINGKVVQVIKNVN
ncbi:MAG: S24 family peptidase [Patescibacteria group bacterium]